jgi:hypothetical protein
LKASKDTSYRAGIAAALLASSTACYVAVPDPVYTPCRIAGSSDWRAEIDTGAAKGLASSSPAR